MNFIVDKILLIVTSIIVSFFFLLGMLFFAIKFPNMGLHFFFFIICVYILLFSWTIIQFDLKHKKGKKLYIGLLILALVNLVISALIFFIAYYFKIKAPEKYTSLYAALIFFPTAYISFIIYDIVYRKALNILLKKKKKIAIEINKFQEKAKERIEDMLKSLGIKYEKFKKIVEGDEILLQSNMEVKGKAFMIEISEEAIALGAEEKEAAFTLELIDYENSKKIINDFCERTKEIFEMVNQFEKH